MFPVKLQKTRSGFSYDGPMRRAIQRFKYHGEYQRGHDLGQRLGELLTSQRVMAADKVDAVIPVPLHPRRYRSRGFNQSLILAHHVAEALGARMVEDLVRRELNTTPQVRLSADQRLRNLEHAFSVDRDKLSEFSRRKLIIVDDVMTTGATLAAVARSLQQAGSGELFGVTLAREH